MTVPDHVPALLLLLWSRVGMLDMLPRFRLVFLSHISCPASAFQLQRPCSKEQRVKKCSAGREGEQNGTGRSP